MRPPFIWSLPSSPSQLPTVGDYEIFGCSVLFEGALFLGWSSLLFISLTFLVSVQPPPFSLSPRNW